MHIRTTVAVIPSIVAVPDLVADMAHHGPLGVELAAALIHLLPGIAQQLLRQGDVLSDAGSVGVVEDLAP